MYEEGDGNEEESTTCYMAQQLGFFHVKDASKCDKVNWNIDTDYSRAEILAMGAEHCCKSKQVDQTVCKAALPPSPPTSGNGAIPCDNPSDFDGQHMIDEEGTCQDLSGFLLPSSAAECTKKPFDDDGPHNKAFMLQWMYAECCARGSKPNGICGFKTSSTTPCENKAEGEFLPDAM